MSPALLFVGPLNPSTIKPLVFFTFVLPEVPPEMTAQCLEGGISFSVVSVAPSVWEVGIDNEPLTAALVAQRGYRLHNDSHRTVLEVPVFSVGYTYEVKDHRSSQVF